MQNTAIGVDVGGTNTKVALVGPDGTILRAATVPTAAHGDVAPFLARLAEVLREFVADGPRGIGMAVPGFLAPDGRSIALNPNTPALVGIDFVAWLEQFGLPARLEQDLNGPALAEHAFGAGRGVRRLMAAPIGTGLGAAVLIDGELLRFTGGSAGDNGHIILQPGGPRCTAGCSGCAEALIAAPAVERLALAALDDPRAERLRASLRDGRILARDVIAAARDGDAPAVAIMREIGGWAGQWLASLTPIFMPELVVLGGGVAEAGAPLLDACRARFAELAGPDYARCTIALSQFGGQAGVIGAAAMFLGVQS